MEAKPVEGTTSASESIPGPAVGYTDLLDHEINEKLKAEEEQRKKGEIKFHPLRPSSAGACARKLAYELMEYRGYAYFPKELKTPPMYRLLELGHSVEFSALRNFQLIKVVKARYKQQVVSLFKLDKVDEALEQELIEGSCDVVLMNEHWKCVLDVKSQKDGWSNARSSRWADTLDKYDRMHSLVKLSDTAWYAPSLPALINELGDDFIVDNLLQVNLYACSPFMVERGIDHGVIYKYNKNTSQHYELRFKPSHELMAAVQEKFNRVNAAVAKKQPELVNRDSVLGSMRCAFCPYKAECWEQDTKKAFYRTLPPKSWPTSVLALGDEGRELDALLAKVEEGELAQEALSQQSQLILSLMDRLHVRKLQTTRGTVFESKSLKSPYPHLELRRSKA